MTAHIANDAFPREATMPVAVRWLGFGGLVPFFTLVGAMALFGTDYRGFLLFVLVSYGAVILSFVGALHWAFAMTAAADQPAIRTRLLAWSVVPALCAWAAMVLPAGFDLILLVTMFWVHFAVDAVWARRLGLPSWYVTLRTVLTVGATLALTLAIAMLLLNPAGPPDLVPAQLTCPAESVGLEV
ncbi:hypothetical protein OTERR_23120 [Oryzomicrobium terrae]|uniref:DUF3429 domain-containing protein n=1 Tax=Oryzomicrobium terrae TaxID=1735038 RepID=A0A5C1EC01_9RHOO|nr:DUF3429 domain-containing protein [Oryzomicrobium terrae]QEL65788.1 hypothetical protein OTERR_23120 [Oryzomicrobium terrae]